MLVLSSINSLSGGAGDEAAGEKLRGLEEELRFLSLELEAVGRNVEQVNPLEHGTG